MIIFHFVLPLCAKSFGSSIVDFEFKSPFVYQDSEKEENSTLRKVSMEDILEAQRKDLLEKEEVERKKNILRHERGLPPHMPDMGLDDFA